MCRLIVDADDFIIGLLGGMPGDPNWDTVQLNASDAIDTTRAQLKFESKDLHHRRGNFPALGVGISHGGGQTVSTLYYLQPLSTYNLRPFPRVPECLSRAPMAQYLIS